MTDERGSDDAQETMPFTIYGRYELLQFTLLALALAALSAFGLSAWVSPWLGWPLAGVFLAAGVFVASFFRDPHREIPGGPLDLVSPADGTVTHVESAVPCDEYVAGKAHMIGIFLSVFNVHVNRAPLDGEVTWLRYKAGKFLDARYPDCGRLNEQQAIGMQASALGGGRVLIKQIAGQIARRIVCPLSPGDMLVRGQRFGMIKFGSRTELWLAAESCDIEWLVKPGDQVKGGLTVLARLTPKNLPLSARFAATGAARA